MFTKRRFIRKGRTKYFLYAIVILFLLVLIGGGGYYIFRHRNQLLAFAETEALKAMKAANHRILYLASEEIKKGEVITIDKLTRTEGDSTMPQHMFLDEIKPGMLALVNIPKGMQVTGNMISTLEIGKGLREVESKVITLNSNIENLDFVDIRLFLPNGEDYIVLSKKSIHKLPLNEEGKAEQTCFLWLTEEEILYLSAAMIDAYLYQGSGLYTTKYIEPAIQEASAVTYVPSLATLKMIEENPHIAQIAEHGLKESLRKSLENRLADRLNTKVSDILWNKEELGSRTENDFIIPNIDDEIGMQTEEDQGRAGKESGGEESGGRESGGEESGGEDSGGRESGGEEFSDKKQEEGEEALELIDADEAGW